MRFIPRCALLGASAALMSCLATETTDNGNGGPQPSPSLIAVPGNAKVTVGWRSMRLDGNKVPAQYEAAATPDTAGLAKNVTAATRTCVTTSDTLCTITGLTNGVAYHVGVRAYKELGKPGGWRQVYPVVPTPLPNAPVQVAAYAANGFAQVAWLASWVAQGDGAVTGYTVASVENPSKSCATTGDTTCDIEGLTNGTAYTFRVRALRSGDTSLATAPTAAVTPNLATVPSPPRNLSALNAGYGPVQGMGPQAVVRWKAPRLTGGSAISGYTVTAVSTDSTVAPVTSTVPLASLPVDADGFFWAVLRVNRGGEHTVSVKATNATGVGSATALPFTYTGTPTLPFAPTAITVVADTGYATVTWTAPFNGGSFITQYRVTVEGSPELGCSSGYINCMVNGLAVNRKYVFIVKAVSDVGVGAAGISDSIAMPTIYPPGAPVNVSGTGLVGGVEVSWFPPAFNGGSRIIGYKAMVVGDTLKSCTSGGTLGGAASFCTIFGLTKNVPYTFIVRAINDIGTGEASEPSAPVYTYVITSPPGAPTALTGVKGNGQVTLSWKPPAYDGDAAITAYVVRDMFDSTVGCSTTGDTSCTVTGLKVGTPYYFRVTAVNSKGASQVSLAYEVFLTLPPGAPTNAHAQSLVGGEVYVLWEDPPNGGSSITLYEVVSLEDTTKTCTSAFTGCNVTGLTNGLAYTFKVRATNGVGTGPWSGPSLPITPKGVPDAPVNVAAVPHNGFAQISWSDGASNGGLPIDNSRAIVQGDPTKFCVTSGSVKTCVIGDLVNGTAYTFVVTASNGHAESAPSAPSAPVTPLQSL